MLDNDGSHIRLILVRQGVYAEKVCITNGSIAIIGEDRTSTILRYPVHRSSWVAIHGDDWGAAVVSLGKGASNVVIGNMTIENTYGDSAKDRSHQFTIRGFDATRISLLYCIIRSAGGDAVSLWNRESGMYYHAFCSFEGWVDYVCPRGWCYVTNSSFFGHNMSASIWHDGSAERSQKFVIRHSAFDGRPGFPLGRHHRDAQFFLLDCTFSKAMADTPIYAPDSPNLVAWQWGARHYFWNCTREGGDYAWHADNLETAEGQPDHRQIGPVWTFDGRWDPERTLPPVLPFPALPVPADGAYEIPRHGAILTWTPARGATAERIALGTDPDALQLHTVTHSTFMTDTLQSGTQYFWYVESDGPDGPARSDQWTFRTER